MITFDEYQYARPEMDAIKEEFTELLNEFHQADSYETQNTVIEKINAIGNDYSTQSNLAYIRSSIDTNDDYYQQERDYFDEVSPEFQGLSTEFYKALITSKFRTELEGKWGSQLFALADNEIRTFSPEVMPLLQQENKLTSEYAKLVASAQIEFDGKELTLAQLGPYMESTDRTVRKNAMNAQYSFYEANDEKFDDIYDRLVKLRDEIAKKLGFSTFTELGYVRMSRVGYDETMVKKFRDQVRDFIVPVTNKLYDRQAERIGVDSLKFYDQSLDFLTGNAIPQGSQIGSLNKEKKCTRNFLQKLMSSSRT